MHEPRGRVPCLLYWLKGAISSWRSESLRAPSRPRNCPLEDFTFFPFVSCLFGVQVRSLVCPVPPGQPIAPRLFGVQVRSLVCPVSLGKPITPCLFGVQARSLCVSRVLFESKLGLSCVPFHWASQSRPVWSRSKLGLSVCPVLYSGPSSVSCVSRSTGQANRALSGRGPSSVSRVSRSTGQANRALSGRGPSSVSPCVPFSVRVQARSLVFPISMGKPIAPCLVAVQARSLRVSRSLFESKLGLLCAPFHWASQSRPVWSRSKLGLSCVPLGKPIPSGRGPSSVSLCVPCSVRVQARSLVCPISLGKPIAPCLVAVQVRSLCVSRSLFESKLGLLCAPSFSHWASQSRPVWSRSQLGLSVCPVFCSSPSSVSRVSHFTGQANRAMSGRGPSSASLSVPFSVRVQARSLVCPVKLGKPIAPCLVAVPARSLCVSRALFESKLGLSCVPFHWASQSRNVWSRSKFGLSVCSVLCSGPSSVSCVLHFTGQANRALSGRGPSSVSPCVPFSVRVQARSLVCPISLGKPIAPCLVAVQARSLVCPVPLGNSIAPCLFGF